MSDNTRLNCNQGSNIPSTWFGCTNQLNISYSKVPVLQNVTSMKSYTSPCTDWIDVYATNNQFQPDCGPISPGDCGDCTNGEVYCWPIDDTFIRPATGTTHSFAISPYFHNNYVTTNMTTSFSGCSNIGWKRVWANKNFNGIPGKTSRLWSAPDEYSWCDACAYHNIDNGADVTRYLRLDANSSITNIQQNYTATTTDTPNAFCCNIDPDLPCGVCTCGADMCIPSDNFCVSYTDAGSITTTGVAASTYSGDKFGNYAASCSSGSFSADAAYSLLTIANDNIGGLIPLYNGFISAIVAATGNQPDSITGTSPDYTLTWHTDVANADECGCDLPPTTQPLFIVSITATTLGVTEFAAKHSGVNHCTVDGTHPVWAIVSDTQYSFNTTTVFYSLSSHNYGSESVSTSNLEEVTGALSVTYTSTQVDTDVITALSKWDLGNDAQYPWRQDSAFTQGPYLSYDEGSTVPVVPMCVGSSPYTGNIIGLPGPIGIDKIWDPAHENWCACDDGFCAIFFVETYGAWSTDCHVPCATQWLTMVLSNSMPDAAFVGNGFMMPQVTTCEDPVTYRPEAKWMCKGAETIFPKQSYDFFRPCGFDRFEPSSSSGRCITSVVGNTVNIDPFGLPFSYSPSDYIWLCGTSQDGLYQASSVSAFSLTLGTQSLSASSLSVSPIANCGDSFGVITKLRFQPLAPAICGHLNIVGATSSNPVTCSFTDPIYFVNGDSVCISNALGLTAMNGTQSVKSIDSTHIALISVNGSGSTSYAGGGIMISPSTPEQSWNTVQPYGNFTYNQFGFDYRGPAEWFRFSASIAGAMDNCDPDDPLPCPTPSLPANPRIHQVSCGIQQQIYNSPTCFQTCLPIYPCAASVAYFSPNAESFNSTSSANLGWPTIATDTQYGAIWMMTIDQYMTDPLFVFPPYPCGNTLPYAQDNYTCEEDDDSFLYYAAPNQYESLCYVPLGAPPLPSGLYLGCVSPASASVTCPPGNYCQPPAIPGSFPFSDTCDTYQLFAYQTNISDFLNKEGCVQNDGRFASIYAMNLI